MRRAARLLAAATVVASVTALRMIGGVSRFTEYYLTVPQVLARRTALGAGHVRVFGRWWSGRARRSCAAR